MASSKFLITLRHLISGRCCFFFFFFLCFFFLFFERCRSEASAAAKTDPIEARAVNTILGRWRVHASSFWNISGELCSGIAINNTAAILDPELPIQCDCNFYNGTVCHITQFTVWKLKVTEPFPEELSKLTYLTDLDVSMNNLIGPLPAFIGNLSSLEHLDFGDNALSGPIPKELGNLKKLITLQMGSNNFTGTIPPELGGLSSLQLWHMHSSGLSGELPASLSKLSTLKALRMQGNSFSGPIPSSFSSLTQLLDLNVGLNYLTGSLPAFIGNISTLVQLDFGTNALSGPIPRELGNLQNLIYLDLGRNNLTGPLPASIGNLSSLQYLDFGTNALSGPIPRELGNLQNLSSLDLGLNNLTGPLPTSIGNLSSLQYLRLGPNYFNGTLPVELGGLRNLQQWDISSSGLSGELPTSLSNLTNMLALMISDNNFIGKIPDFIATWSNLTVLRMQGNSISGPIPSKFFNLSELYDLRIGDLINGTSSLAFIGNMTNLGILILRNAKISDILPSEFAKYISLVILDLSFNNITGSIPQSLLSLSSLQLLSIGNNSITGTLPRKRSSTLINIDLSYNQLSGSFPFWVKDPNLLLNLVANNFVIDNSNSSGLPSGFECLQRDMPCYRDSPSYYQFAINCGGDTSVTSSNGTNFDIDNANLSATSYFVTDVRKWAVSNAGSLIDALNPKANYIISSSIQSQNALDSKLFKTARTSPSSLRYYGLGLKNGNYTIKLQFSEIGIPDQLTWTNVGRRVFDIYIQGMLKEKDFDIRKEAGGKSFTVVLKEYQAPVTNNFLEIHFFWAGKGTNFIPSSRYYVPSISSISLSPYGYYGPSISAISLSPYDFMPSVSNKSPHSSLSNNTTALVVGIVFCAAVLGLIVFAILVWKHKQKNLSKDNEELLGMTVIPNTFSYVELRTATEDFNQSNFLGEGGFGPVYKGKLHDGRMVAIKQLSIASKQGERQFMAEIATISAVQHRNLAKLYGCCIEGDKRLLVYEYLENKSLDQAIFKKKNLQLDWATRFEICLGVARGLAYLHEGSSVRIIHRDVKSSNILLDANLTPKISDFGLAKLYDDKWTHISTRVAGTFGYMAPEYAMRGHLTEKADVFSFGVVALEVLSGKPNSDLTLEEEQSYLLDWAWHLYEQKHELDLVDPSLSSYNRDEATRVIGVSLLCIQASPTLRPPMSTVVAMLAGFIEIIEVTSRPSYLTEWQFNDINNKFASDGFCKSADTRATNSQVSVPSNPD